MKGLIANFVVSWCAGHLLFAYCPDKPIDFYICAVAVMAFVIPASQFSWQRQWK